MRRRRILARADSRAARLSHDRQQRIAEARAPVRGAGQRKSVERGAFVSAPRSWRGFPTCCIADFQSAGPPTPRTRAKTRKTRRLEALRYSRLETWATSIADSPHCLWAAIPKAFP